MATTTTTTLAERQKIYGKVPVHKDESEEIFIQRVENYKEKGTKEKRLIIENSALYLFLFQEHGNSSYGSDEITSRNFIRDLVTEYNAFSGITSPVSDTLMVWIEGIYSPLRSAVIDADANRTQIEEFNLIFKDTSACIAPYICTGVENHMTCIVACSGSGFDNHIRFLHVNTGAGKSKHSQYTMYRQNSNNQRLVATVGEIIMKIIRPNDTKLIASSESMNMHLQRELENAGFSEIAMSNEKHWFPEQFEQQSGGCTFWSIWYALTFLMCNSRIFPSGERGGGNAATNGLSKIGEKRMKKFCSVLCAHRAARDAVTSLMESDFEKKNTEAQAVIQLVVSGNYNGAGLLMALDNQRPLSISERINGIIDAYHTPLFPLQEAIRVEKQNTSPGIHWSIKEINEVLKISRDVISDNSSVSELTEFAAECFRMASETTGRTARQLKYFSWFRDSISVAATKVCMNKQYVDIEYLIDITNIVIDGGISHYGKWDMLVFNNNTSSKDLSLMFAGGGEALLYLFYVIAKSMKHLGAFEAELIDRSTSVAIGTFFSKTNSEAITGRNYSFYNTFFEATIPDVRTIFCCGQSGAAPPLREISKWYSKNIVTVLPVSIQQGDKTSPVLFSHLLPQSNNQVINLTLSHSEGGKTTDITDICRQYVKMTEQLMVLLGGYNHESLHNGTVILLPEFIHHRQPKENAQNMTNHLVLIKALSNQSVSRGEIGPIVKVALDTMGPFAPFSSQVFYDFHTQYAQESPGVVDSQDDPSWPHPRGEINNYSVEILKAQYRMAWKNGCLKKVDMLGVDVALMMLATAYIAVPESLADAAGTALLSDPYAHGRNAMEVLILRHLSYVANGTKGLAFLTGVSLLSIPIDRTQSNMIHIAVASAFTYYVAVHCRDADAEAFSDIKPLIDIMVMKTVNLLSKFPGRTNVTVSKEVSPIDASCSEVKSTKTSVYGGGVVEEVVEHAITRNKNVALNMVRFIVFSFEDNKIMGRAGDTVKLEVDFNLLNHIQQIPGDIITQIDLLIPMVNIKVEGMNNDVISYSDGDAVFRFIWMPETSKYISKTIRTILHGHGYHEGMDLELFVFINRKRNTYTNILCGPIDHAIVVVVDLVSEREYVKTHVGGTFFSGEVMVRNDFLPTRYDSSLIGQWVVNSNGVVVRDERSNYGILFLWKREPHDLGILYGTFKPSCPWSYDDISTGESSERRLMRDKFRRKWKRDWIVVSKININCTLLFVERQIPGIGSEAAFDFFMSTSNWRGLVSIGRDTIGPRAITPSVDSQWESASSILHLTKVTVEELCPKLYMIGMIAMGWALTTRQQSSRSYLAVGKSKRTSTKRNVGDEEEDQWKHGASDWVMKHGIQRTIAMKSGFNENELSARTRSMMQTQTATTTTTVASTDVLSTIPIPLSHQEWVAVVNVTLASIQEDLGKLSKDVLKCVLCTTTGLSQMKPINRNGTHFPWPMNVAELISANISTDQTKENVLLKWIYGKLAERALMETRRRLNEVASNAFEAEVEAKYILYAIDPINAAIVDFKHERTLVDVITEMSSEHLMRIEQSDALQKIRLPSNAGHVVQARMGLGKTSFISPNLIYEELLSKQEKEKLSAIIIVPENLVSQSERIITKMASALGFVTIYALTFESVEPDITGADYSIVCKDFLTFPKHDSLSAGIKPRKEPHGLITVISDKALQRLFLLIARINKENEEDKNRKSFWKRLQNSIVICDEVDNVVDPLSCTMNIPYGESIVSPERIKDIVSVVGSITPEEEAKRQGVASPIPKKYSVNLGDDALMHAITSAVHMSRSMVLSVNYGFGAENSGYNDSNHMMAIPFRKANDPLNGSEFSDIVLSIALSCAAYEEMIVKQGSMRAVDLSLLAKVLLDSTIHIEGIDTMTLTKIALGDFGPGIAESMATFINTTVEKKSKETERKLEASVKQFSNSLKSLSEESRRAFLARYVSIVLSTYAKQYGVQMSVGMLEFLSPVVSKRRVMFSGTVNVYTASENEEKVITDTFYHKVTRENWESITGKIPDIESEDMINAIMTGYAPVDSVDLIAKNKKRRRRSSEKTEELFANRDEVISDDTPGVIIIESAIRDEHRETENALINKVVQGNYGALMDSAGILHLDSALQYARKFWRLFGGKRDILFVDNGVQSLCRNDIDAPVPRSTMIGGAETAFLFYDQKSTIGIDFEQVAEINGIVTITAKSTHTEVAQAATRLRRLSMGHTIDFVYVRAAGEDPLFAIRATSTDRVSAFKRSEYDRTEIGHGLAIMAVASSALRMYQKNDMIRFDVAIATSASSDANSRDKSLAISTTCNNLIHGKSNIFGLNQLINLFTECTLTKWRSRMIELGQEMPIQTHIQMKTSVETTSQIGMALSHWRKINFTYEELKNPSLLGRIDMVETALMGLRKLRSHSSTARELAIEEGVLKFIRTLSPNIPSKGIFMKMMAITHGITEETRVTSKRGNSQTQVKVPIPFGTAFFAKASFKTLVRPTTDIEAIAEAFVCMETTEPFLIISPANEQITISSHPIYKSTTPKQEDSDVVFGALSPTRKDIRITPEYSKRIKTLDELGLSNLVIFFEWLASGDVARMERLPRVINRLQKGETWFRLAWSANEEMAHKRHRRVPCSAWVNTRTSGSMQQRRAARVPCSAWINKELM